MKKHLTILYIIFALATTACNLMFKPPFGGPKLIPTETFPVDEAAPDGAAIPTAVLALAPSNATVSLGGEAMGLIDGTIQYNVADWKPTLAVESNALRIEQKVPDGSVAITPKGGLNKWDLKISDTVTNINISSPAGNHTLNFAGTLPDGVSISVNAGAGSLRLVFPAAVTVDVEVHRGLANITTEGEWTTSGKTYSSGNSGPVWMVKVDIGAGNVTLAVE